MNVEPFRGGGITVPYWEGESIPIDYKTARKVGIFRSQVTNRTIDLTNKIIDKLKTFNFINHTWACPSYVCFESIRRTLTIWRINSVS